jgi:ankyrin repeat protein
MMAKSKRRALLGGLFIAIVVVSILAFVIAAPDEETRFIKAVQDGDVATVAALLNKRSELVQLEPLYGRKGGKQGTEPVLKTALRQGHNGVVRLLLDHGAVPEKYSNILVFARDVEAAQLLIDHGADVNRQNEYGEAAQHFFVTRDDTSIAEFLLSRGADVNVRDGHGETPLHRAAREGCLSAAKLLVSKGADINAKTRGGSRTPFDYAVMAVWDEDAYGMDQERIRKCKEVAAYLLSCGSACTVFDLAWLGDVERLTTQLALDPSLANARANGEPLLFAAIRGGSAEAVEYLLSRGAHISVTGRFGQTPLQVAAYIGHTAVAQALLSHGAGVDAKGPWGETALHWAAVKGNTDVASLLLQNGADPNVQTTAHAVELNVLDRDADPVERELKWFQICEDQRRHNSQVMMLTRLAFTTGDTPLHAAAYWNHPDIVELLVARGADVKKTNRWGETALHLAAASGQIDVAQRLLDAGADPLMKIPGGMTAVEIAGQIKDKKLAGLLTKRPPR